MEDNGNGPIQTQLDSARDWVSAGGSVLLFGPARTGKSAALEVLADTVPAAQVLAFSPDVDDRQWPFAGIVGLLSSVDTADMNSFFATRKDVISRMNCVGGKREHHLDRFAASVSVAAFRLIQLMSLTGPVMLMVDDAHLLDRASALVLETIAKHLHGMPVQLVVAELVEAGQLPTCQMLCPEPRLLMRYGFA